ncbi:MAG: molybdenum ABC transporter ATP-binding protein [Pseudomonadota bacterium]
MAGTLMLSVNVQLQRGDFTLDARFDAPTPGVTALFGRSGCGKTSLINVIAGLTADGAGKVCLDDECWLDTPADIRRRAEQRHVGYVFQDARLFPHYSVRGNLEYGARRVKGTVTAGLFDDVVALLGLSALLARRPGGLSGGEKQRVALGRALLSQPRLLLLDEPLSSLDAARREEVLPYLERLRDHFAIPMVYVSHQFDEILRLATHVVVMDAGRVTATGELGSVSRSSALQAIVGADAMGAVIDGRVTSVDAASGLAEVAIGQGLLRVPAGSLSPGQDLRVQLLARDLILAVTEPHGLSVRNQLRGVVRGIASSGGNDLVEVECAGVTLLSRVTGAATRELELTIGTPVWVLVKAVSVSGLAH